MIAPRPLVLVALTIVALALPALAGSAEGPPATTPPDPCELGIDVPGNANGLDKRCEAVGGGSGVARGDFNGDGIGDLAVGVPFEDIGGAIDAGAVNVIYGTILQGLRAEGNQFLHENSAGVGGASESNDHFGYSLAAGDFNGDGMSDLAVGVPEQDSGSAFPDWGKVSVFRGTADGLVYHRLLTGDYGRSGAALAWGDFDNDGYGDLAIGSPNADVFDPFFSARRDAGTVTVEFGSAIGLGNPEVLWFKLAQTADGTVDLDVGDSSEPNDHFGAALAAGDFDNDGLDDFAIGVPNEDVNLFGTDEGMAHLVFGAENGFSRRVTHTAANWCSVSSCGPQNNAQFGRVLAMGDAVAEAPGEELFVGAPYHDGLTSSGTRVADSGIVYYRTSLGNRFLRQQGSGSGDALEAGDRFGWAIALGNFDGVGVKEFAVGAPGEDIGAVANAGVVHVLVHNGQSQVWSQDSSGVPDSAEAGDTFGASLSAWNFGRGTPTDLAIGVPYEDSGGLTNLGFVQVTYGGFSTGVGNAGSVQTWSQATTGIEGDAESNDLFGYSLY